MSNFSEEEYLQRLEEERSKIKVFQRELPLCLDLVTQAIEICKENNNKKKKLLLSRREVTRCKDLNECYSEQTSSEIPLLEEFIPIKRHSADSSDYSEEDRHCNKPPNNNDKSNKSDWLKSVQLWNQTPDPLPSNQDFKKKDEVVEVNRNGNGGAFHPFKKSKSVDADATASPVERALPWASTISTAATSGGGSGSGSGNKKEDKRKERRCWSTELHRRFLQALQQLGGSHVATPKQIRELMKVDGLTNDEVKSHLQKYRLHTRRPSSSVQNAVNNNTQGPQFVVVGGIWVPPEYAAMAATSGEASGVANTNGIYAPIATLPPPFREASASPKPKQRETNSDCRISHSECHVQSHSPATSTSTHTTTESPAY